MPGGRKGSARVTRFSAKEAAAAADISKNTLLRWLKQGKVPEVARDRNGWRIFTEEDVERIRAYAQRTTPPEAFAPGAEPWARTPGGAPDVSQQRLLGRGGGGGRGEAA